MSKVNRTCDACILSLNLPWLLGLNYHFFLKGWITAAYGEQDKLAAEKKIFPPCNSEWSGAKGQVSAPALPTKSYMIYFYQVEMSQSLWFHWKFNAAQNIVQSWRSMQGSPWRKIVIGSLAKLGVSYTVAQGSCLDFLVLCPYPRLAVIKTRQHPLNGLNTNTYKLVNTSHFKSL